MRAFTFPVLLAIALMVAGNLAHASKFYRWTDENGVTHYTQTPPPKGVQGNEVRVTGGPSSDQAEELQALEERRQQAAAQREREAEQQQQAAREKDQPDEVSKERCEQHRKNLQALENRPIVRQEDPETGEVITLDAAARDQALAETREALKRCEQE